MTKRLVLVFIVLGIFFLPFSLKSASYERSFFTDSRYDERGLNFIDAQLIKTTNKFYIYAQKDWYFSLNFNQKQQLETKLNEITNIFEYQFYPKITSLLTTEEIPGVDNDPRLILVLEKMNDEVGGYIRSVDSYSKSLVNNSNEGQIIFLNAKAVLEKPSAVSLYYLFHEFTHLVTLKVKPNIEVWLAELLAEFSSTLIDNDFSFWLTQRRASQLLSSTSLNLNLWKERSLDYARVYLMALYLKEQFSDEIFKDILFSQKEGIFALEEALKKRGVNLNDFLLNFLIANILNDCSIDKKYCYQNKNLKDFQVLSNSYYLPTTGESTMTVTDSLLKWEGKWQKIVGGNGILKLKFTLPEEVKIAKIPYILVDSDGKKTLNFIDFSKTNIQEITVFNFGSQYQALIFIPFLGKEAQDNKVYYYSWEAKTLTNNPLNEEKLKQELLNQINLLKQKIALLQQQLSYLLTLRQAPQCSSFNRDLFYGMRSEEVKCLQIFLKNLGPEIYPEGLVTGYFGPLTLKAVQNYQRLKGIVATGYFGPLTRAVVNQELK